MGISQSCLQHAPQTHLNLSSLNPSCSPQQQPGARRAQSSKEGSEDSNFEFCTLRVSPLTPSPVWVVEAHNAYRWLPAKS